MNNIKENELILNASKGDKQAFGELIREHTNKIYNLALVLSGNKTEAEDLLQEVFLKAFKNIKGFKGKSYFSTWLYRITINLWKNRAKHNRIIKFLSINKFSRNKDNEKIEKEIIFTNITPENEAEKKEIDNKIKEALDKLNKDQKISIILKHFEDKSIKEISIICGCSTRTIEYRISKGMKKLKEYLKSYIKE